MLHKRSGSVRQEQKKSLYKKEFSRLFQALMSDVPAFTSLAITRVDVSADGGICYLFFSSFLGKDDFLKLLATLKLYRGSLRAAMSRSIKTRYVPDLIFLFDEELEKQRELEALLDQVKETETNASEE